MKAIFSSKFRL